MKKNVGSSSTKMDMFTLRKYLPCSWNRFSWTGSWPRPAGRTGFLSRACRARTAPVNNKIKLSEIKRKKEINLWRDKKKQAKIGRRRFLSRTCQAQTGPVNSTDELKKINRKKETNLRGTEKKKSRFLSRVCPVHTAPINNTDELREINRKKATNLRVTEKKNVKIGRRFLSRTCPLSSSHCSC